MTDGYAPTRNTVTKGLMPAKVTILHARSVSACTITNVSNWIIGCHAGSMPHRLRLWNNTVCQWTIIVMAIFVVNDTSSCTGTDTWHFQFNARSIYDTITSCCPFRATPWLTMPRINANRTVRFVWFRNSVASMASHSRQNENVLRPIAHIYQKNYSQIQASWLISALWSIPCCCIFSGERH